MRFKLLRSDVTKPNKVSPGHYINVRSAQRIDVFPNNSAMVETGLKVYVSKTETARLVGDSVDEVEITSGELFIPVVNPSDTILSIYPGQVLADISVSTVKQKRATFVSSAELVEGKN